MGTKKRKRKSVKLFFRNGLTFPRHDEHHKLLSFFTLRLIFSLLFPMLQTFREAFVLLTTMRRPTKQILWARNKKGDSMRSSFYFYFAE